MTNWVSATVLKARVLRDKCLFTVSVRGYTHWDLSVDTNSSSLFEWTDICLNLNYIILQEVSGSIPQKDVVDRSKSIIETSGKTFASWDFL